MEVGCIPSRMRKKTAVGVLAPLAGSPYDPEYDLLLSSPRPCWTAFLRILHGGSMSSHISISVTDTEVSMSFPQPARGVRNGHCQEFICRATE